DLMPPPSKCTTAIVQFCDGFELGALSSTWFPFGGGTVAVDKSHVYRGTYALHARLDPAVTGGDRAHAIGTVTSPVPDVYVRAFFFAPGPLPSQSIVAIRLQEDASPQFSIDLDFSQSAVFTTHDSKTNTDRTSSKAVPTDRWFCAEWHV